MNTKRIKQSIRLWRVDGVPKEIQRHNQRAWLRMVALLGDKWLFNRPRTGDELRRQYGHTA